MFRADTKLKPIHMQKREKFKEMWKDEPKLVSFRIVISLIWQTIALNSNNYFFKSEFYLHAVARLVFLQDSCTVWWHAQDMASHSQFNGQAFALIFRRKQLKLNATIKLPAENSESRREARLCMGGMRIDCCTRHTTAAQRKMRRTINPTIFGCIQSTYTSISTK